MHVFEYFSCPYIGEESGNHVLNSHILRTFQFSYLHSINSQQLLSALLSDSVILIQPFEIIHSCVFHFEIGIGGESPADVSKVAPLFN